MKLTKYDVFLGVSLIVSIVCFIAGMCAGYTIKKTEIIEVEKEVIKYVEVEKPATTIQAQPKKASLGMFTATAYFREDYPHICNDGDGTITATGTETTVGRTIAVDPSVIPYGTEVIINGHTYIAEDTGSAIKGNRVDILFATHNEALDFGVQQVEVFVLETQKGAEK